MAAQYKSENLYLHSLKAISPIDGRHRLMTEPLSDWFSEFALFKYRIHMEVEYLVALSECVEFTAVRDFTLEEKNFLKSIVKNFTLQDAQVIQDIDRFGYQEMKPTNHDCKSVEYFLKMKMKESSLNDMIEFVHFGLTSEDMNNIAHDCMVNGALRSYYIPSLVSLLNKLAEVAEKEKSTAMLGRTHGQPATPTTFGKEVANYLDRLRKQLIKLNDFKLPAKCNGAVGNHAAQHFAAEEVDWISFTGKFIANLGFEANLMSTQIEFHDGFTELFSIMININNILKDLAMDFWTYTSLGYLQQEKIVSEVGSSTMPHKINPWRLEVAEGSAAEANAKFIGFINKLQVSRLQRDLSDHEAQRAIGVGFAHSYLVVLHVLEELERLQVNPEKISNELKDFGSILTEAVQTLLRKEGYSQPYELLKDFSRGRHCTVQELHDFIGTLEIKEETKLKLKSLRPESYTGLSKELTELAIKRWGDFKEEYEEPLPAVKKVFLDPEIKTVEILEKLKQMEIEVLDELVEEKGVLYIGPINEKFEEAKEKGLICINYDPERKTKAEYNIVDLSELPDLINSFGGN
jgi:adenylosuccinate lyase